MDIAAPTDAELLTARVDHRREDAFHTLVSRYAGLVHSAAKRACADDALAADAAQKRLDRATERLREKLTRRGVTTAGSLSAVMLAGFSADAQAAVISTSVLSSKVIAASSATSTGILATLTAMKASTYIAPAFLLY